MARYKPKDIQYPLIKIEYHIVTPAGVTSCAFDDLKLASARLRSCPASWRLVEVQTVSRAISPVRTPKSDTVVRIAESHGIPVIDHKLALVG